jgi:hypothetical protein
MISLIQCLYTIDMVGAAFIFLGALCIQDNDQVASIVIGCFIIATGAIYVAMQFASKLGHPQPLFSGEIFDPVEPAYPPSRSRSSSSIGVPRSAAFPKGGESKVMPEPHAVSHSAGAPELDAHGIPPVNPFKTPPREAFAV